MEPIIVRERSAEIRAIARNALRDNWVKVTIAMGLYYLLTTTVPALLTSLIPSASYVYYNEVLGQSIRVSYVANLYDFLLTGAFLFGMSSFLLAFFRHRDMHPGHLFNGFEHFIKAFCLVIVEGFFIFLWSLLLVIPGIIAAFRYSQAFYILADHPEIGVMGAMNESKRMMEGNKSRFFWLNMSFIGWLLLASLVSGWVPGSWGVVGIIVDFVCAIPSLFVMAYQNTAQTAFYELASGHLVASVDTSFREEDYHF